MGSLTPKEIGRVAGRRFNNALPKDWAVRSQEDQEDYGVDYEIELTTPSDQATGFIFKVQQKGVEKSKTLADGQTISFSLETEKVAYYLRQLRIPIVLVLVDLATNQIMWVPLHGNAELMQSLSEAEKKNRASLTIHFSPDRTLPDTAELLLTEVQHMMDFLSLEALKHMPIANARAAVAKELDLDSLSRSLKLTESIVRTERTQRLIDSGRLAEALALSRKAFVDDEQPIEARFAAGMDVIRIAGGIVATQPTPGSLEELVRLRIEITHKLAAQTRSLPASHHLRHYSLFLARNARLRLLVDRDFGIFFSRKAQAERLEDFDFASTMVAGAQQVSTRGIVAELRRTQRRIVDLLRNGWPPLVVYAWSELTETLGPFLRRLKEDGLEDGAQFIRKWLDEVGLACREYARSSKDDAAIALCVLNHVRIGIDTDTYDERESQARELANAIGDPEVREDVLQRLERLAELSRPADHEEPEVLDQAEVEQVVRQMARGLGIDVDDPSDGIAYITRVGIRDYNPERVLRDCEHLHVKIVAYGIPAQMLGLPTAGTKSVQCLKHRYRSDGVELDRVYGFFKERHCGGCGDCTPRPADWRWTHRWQRDQDERLEAPARGGGPPKEKPRD